MRSTRRFAVLLAAFVAAGCNRDTVPITAPSVETPPANFDLAAATVATPMVSAGDTESCALRADGTLACWGANYWGVSSPPNGIYTRVELGISDACAVAAAGHVTCWGQGAWGETRPPGAPAGLTYTDVSIGRTSVCAVRSDGALVCWGDTRTGLTSPPSGGFTRVSVAQHYACAVRTDGGRSCWGSDQFGVSAGAPAAPAGSRFVQISSGMAHACALFDDGSLQCWGANDHGQTNVPELPAGVKYTQVSASFNSTFTTGSPAHSCALRSDGTAVCWGASGNGQLGVPALPANVSYTSITAGMFHSCAARSDGAVLCWGLFTEGRLNVPPTLNLLRPTQPIEFSPPVPASAYIGTTFELVPNVGSGNPVVYNVTTPTVCFITGTTISFLALGTCAFTANRAGNDEYDPSRELAVSVSVVNAPQSIAFTTAAPSPAYVGTTWDVAATGGGSANPVTFSSVTTSICTVSGATVTFAAQGNCRVAANQAGNDVYDAAPQATILIAVSRRPQAIAFSPALPTQAVLGTQLTTGATGGASGNPVVLSVLTPSTCSLSGATLTLTTVGDCTVAADQAGNTAYNAAPRVTATVATHWPFGGFIGFTPPPGLNSSNAGASIPISFSLGGNRGLPVIAAKSPTAMVYACGTTPPAPGTGSTVRGPGKTGAEYSASTGLYTYTWKSAKSLAGKCVQLSVELLDGSIRTLLFRLR